VFWKLLVLTLTLFVFVRYLIIKAYAKRPATEKSEKDVKNGTEKGEPVKLSISV
jgi:hypothetical protein